MIGRLAARLVKPRRPRLLVQSLALALAIAGVTISLMSTPVGERLEQRTVDARFAERGTLDAPKDVVVVAIDRTQESYGGSWPISRSLWADAIEHLSDAGVAGIAIDVPMDWTAFNPTEDTDLVEAIAASDVPVVLATRADQGHGASPVEHLDDRARALVEPGDVRSGMSARERAVDGVVRSYPVRGAGGRDDRAGLAAALVSAAGGEDAVERAPDELLLGYYGPRATFEHISFANVAYGLDTLRDLEGKLVVIGPTEGVARDDHAAPIGGRMSSAEIQATAAANLLDGSWLREPATWVGAAAVVAAALLVWALLLVVPLGLAVPAAAGAIAGWGWLAVDLFERGLVVPMLAPMLAGAITFAGIAITLSVVAVRERIRVKSLFARYVHADVVRELVDGEDRIELGGEEREITVLFSDIRGFTSMSEHVDPIELVAQLNEYFEAMVEVVADEQGTVDKFLGDGMMAIFGAPARHADHAARACRAATAMLDRLDDVNRDRGVRGLTPLRIGIGIHTGRAVVGNVGSPPFRVDFTAIGDTVNLAARIEAMTKELDAPIVASDATRASVEAHTPGVLAFDPLGTVVARGRTEPTTVHAVSRAQAVAVDLSDAA
jgi:adenylate cyclase